MKWKGMRFNVTEEFVTPRTSLQSRSLLINPIKKFEVLDRSLVMCLQKQWPTSEPGHEINPDGLLWDLGSKSSALPLTARHLEPCTFLSHRKDAAAQRWITTPWRTRLQLAKVSWIIEFPPWVACLIVLVVGLRGMRCDFEARVYF